jgi:hypothetical protein
MKKLYLFYLYGLMAFFLSSCEFHCSLGSNDAPKGDAKVIDGTRVYNDIQLEQLGVKVEKAYLVFENNDPVPQSNVIDFTQPVKLILVINEGWKETDNKVKLGVSETILAPDGQVMLDEKDLFAKYTDGITPVDAKKISIMAKIIIKQKMDPLTTFNVKFNVWDKNSNNYIKGSYKLYSK